MRRHGPGSKRRALLVLACWALVAAGCSRAGALFGDAPAGSAAAPVPGPPVFIENDYDRARDEALRRGVPLVVFGWSPWCTDCLGMKAYVFSDPALTCLGTRFVWLALDTDREQNAGFWGRFPIETTPTLWVLDPDRQRAALHHAGPLSRIELQAMLEDVEPLARPRAPAAPDASASASASGRPPLVCPGAASGSASASASAPPAAASAPASASASASAAPPPPPPPPPPRDPEREAAARLLEATVAEADGSPRAAERAYRQALEAPGRWPRRAQAVDGLQRMLLARRDLRGCVELSSRELPGLPVSTLTASVAQRALRCARRLGDREGPAAERAASAVESVVRSPTPALLPSQRSNLYEDAVFFFKANKDPERAQRLAREWSDLLALEATLARTADQRAVFDEHRQRVNRELDALPLTLPPLEQTARERPDDYAAQARLARALADLGRRPEALERLRLALPASQGQGRLRIGLLMADLLHDMHRTDEARRTLVDAIEQAERNPPPIDHDQQMRELHVRLRGLTER